MAQQQPQSELYNQNNPYMWPRSKCWIRASRASIQHAATKVTNIDSFHSQSSSVLSILPEANQNFFPCWH